MPGTLDVDAADTLIRYRRGELEAAFAGAMAISTRHSEERRNNWLLATSAGCLAATELGRTAELRAVLERERLVPRELTAQGFEALATPTFSMVHQVGHLLALTPCLFEPGDTGAKRRADALAALDVIQSPDWPTDRRFRLLRPFLGGDREQLVVAILSQEDEAETIEDRARRFGLWRWWGVAEDPRLVAHRQRIDARVAEARAALPAQLAAEGISATP